MLHQCLLPNILLNESEVILSVYIESDPGSVYMIIQNIPTYNIGTEIFMEINAFQKIITSYLQVKYLKKIVKENFEESRKYFNGVLLFGNNSR